nr:hypothetical protein TorRG33x02_322740 [Ipomoea batatas]
MVAAIIFSIVKAISLPMQALGPALKTGYFLISSRIFASSKGFLARSQKNQVRAELVEPPPEIVKVMKVSLRKLLGFSWYAFKSEDIMPFEDFLEIKVGSLLSVTIKNRKQPEFHRFRDGFLQQTPEFEAIHESIGGFPVKLPELGIGVENPIAKNLKDFLETGTLWVVNEVFVVNVIDVCWVTRDEHVQVGKGGPFQLKCAAIVFEKLRREIVEAVGIFEDRRQHSDDWPVCGN